MDFPGNSALAPTQGPIRKLWDDPTGGFLSARVRPGCGRLESQWGAYGNVAPPLTMDQ